MKLGDKFIKTFNRVISLLLVVTMVVPAGMDHMYDAFNEQASSVLESIESDSIGHAAGWPEGGSGGTGAGGDTNFAGGIFGGMYPDVGFSISVSRDKYATYYTDAASGRNPSDNLWENSNYAYLENYGAAVFVIPVEAVNNSHWKTHASALYSYNGSGNIAYAGELDAAVVRDSDNMQKLPTANGVYYTKIYDMIKQPDGIAKIKKDWDTLFTATAPSKTVWSYIAGPCEKGGTTNKSAYAKYDVEGRFDAVFNHNNLDYTKFEDFKDEQALQMTAQMIDTLATLYTMSPAAASKESFKRAAMSFLDGADLKEEPLTIKIQPVTAIRNGSQKKLYVMRTIDLTGWYTALQSAYRLDTRTWREVVKNSPDSAKLRGNFREMLSKATDDSMLEAPDVARSSSERGEGGVLKYASTGFYSKIFKSYGKSTWQNKNSGQSQANLNDVVVYYPKSTGKPDKLTSANAMWGTLLIPFGRPGMSNVPFGKIEALPDGHVIDTKELGKPVTVNLYAGIDGPEGKDNWKSIINNAASSGSTFKIQVKIDRVDSPYGPAGLDDFVLDGVTPEKMTSFINGEMIGTAIDEVQSYASPELEGSKTEVIFNYKADFTVTTVINGEPMEYKGESEDPASFIVLPERMGYTSKPEAYVELKNYGAGSNMNGALSETWEAMAGVPSTEQLYFAAGGSEFIVDVTVEYVKDEVARRSYDSYYTKTKCEFYSSDCFTEGPGKSWDFRSTGSQKNPTDVGSWVDNSISCSHENGGDWVISAKWTGNNSHEQNMTFSCCVNLFSDCTVDTSTYDKAMAAADKLISELNAETLSFTSGSDKWKRDVKWSASVTTDDTDNSSGHNPGRACQSGCRHPGSCSSGGKDHSHSGSKGSNGSPCPKTHPWTIVITATIPAHAICGPCCSHEIPETHDTWTQSWKYDSMKISDVHVWQIDQAATESLDEIIGPSVDIGGAQGTLADGLVGADVRQGRPSIFYNIALKYDKDFVKQDGRNGNATGTSEAGRVRYNLAGSWKDAPQHDQVKWNLGVRQNKCDGLANTYSTNVRGNGGQGHTEEWAPKGFIYNGFKPSPSTTGGVPRFTSSTTGVRSTGEQDWPLNKVGFLKDKTDSVDKSTPEYKAFLEKREQSMVAWMITDFLILQTSSGDQSVLYFDAKNPSTGKVTAESEIPELNVEKEKMWLNNQYSAAKWPEDHVNLGSYNGKYATPSKKFKVTSKGHQPQTIFDGREGGGKDPAKTIIRPARPSKNLMLYNGALNIILRDVNKKYETGDSEVFWANLLHWTDVSSDRFTVNPSNAPFSTISKIGDLTKFDFSRKCGIVNAGNVHCKPGTDLKAPGFAPKHGFIMTGIYSKEHTKINDIIVHDPVSTENVALISLPDERDQRYGEVIGADFSEDLINGSLVCPGEPGLCDFRFLDCTYFKNTKVGDFDFDTLDLNKNPINKITKNGLVLPSGFSLATKPSGSGMSGNVLYSNNGTRLEIPLAELGIQYTPALRLQAEAKVRLTSMASKQMIMSFKGYGLYVDESGNIGFTTGNNDYRKATNIKISTNTDYNIKAIFSFKQINSCELYVNGTKAIFSSIGAEPNRFTGGTIGSTFNIGSFGTSTAYKFSGYMDNLVLTRLQGTAYHTDDCTTAIMTHPNGLNTHIHTDKCLDGKYTCDNKPLNSGPYTLTCGKSTSTIICGNTTSSITNCTGIANSGGSSRTIYRFYHGSGCTYEGATHYSTSSNRCSCDHASCVNRNSGSQTLPAGYSVWLHNNRTDMHISSTKDRCSVCGMSGSISIQSNFTTHTHTSACYHTHTTSCYHKHIGSSSSGTGCYTKPTTHKHTSVCKFNGAEGVADNIIAGQYTEEELREILGDTIYNQLDGKIYGKLLHTWSGWTSSNTMGFTSANGTNLTMSGNNMHATVKSGSIEATVPVEIGAGSIRQVKVYLDNNTAASGGGLFPNNSRSYDVWANMKPYTSNQVLTFNVYDTWKNLKLSSLQFDFASGNTTGNVVVKRIEIYGTGTKTTSSSSTGKVYNYSYTGGVQSVTLPAGEYKLEVWGAEGGAYNAGYAVGLGGYATGKIKLTQAGSLMVYIGGKGGDASGNGGIGGWNGGGYGRDSHGGGGGGKTHIEQGGTVIIAGGGGGGSGHRGGGLHGGSSLSPYGSGGMGNSCSAYTAPGGYSYINTYQLSNTGYSAGVRYGHGKATITSLFSPVTISGSNTGLIDRNTIINTIKNNWQTIPNHLPNGDVNPIWVCELLPLNKHVCDHKCHEEMILQCSEPHHQNMHYDGSNSICWKPCNNDEKHKQFKDKIITTDGTFTPGNFINLDWGFDIYFPNIGDFEQGQLHGLGQLTTTRGKNFTDNMDTSKWTRVKRVKFPVNVIRNGVLYVAGEWITLADRGEYTGKDGSKYSEKNWTNYGTEIFNAVHGDLIGGSRNGVYHFYCVEANEEIAAGEVRVEVEAVNCPGSNDNTEETTNRRRMKSFKSLHGGTNTFYMDVVGRIGNLVMEDTGDYRFSNLFKQAVEADDTSKPLVYRVSNNGLTAIGGALLSSSNIQANTAGAGAQVENINLTTGQYKITVDGEELNNGSIKIVTQSGWNIVGEYEPGSGITVDERVPENEEDIVTPAGMDVTVTSDGLEMEPGKYRLELFGQGFLKSDISLRVYNPKSKVYMDLTGKCEHIGKTNEKATILIDLPDGLEFNATSNGLELLMDTKQNVGFIFDRMVVKRLDTDSVKNIATTDSVKRVTVSTKTMSYYVNIAADTPVEISYIARNSGGMQVNSISVQRLGDYDDTWVVEGIVKKVDESKQNEYLSWGINDIRGVRVSEATQWLNTYATQNWMNKAPIRLPLSPSKNNIGILKDEPMLVGYDLYMDISTIGRYFENNKSFLQVLPYYYAIDLNNPKVEPIPVDAYLKYSKGYYPVNIFGLVTGQNKKVTHATDEYREYTMDDIYNFTANLDWVAENERRNYTAVEKYQSETLSGMLGDWVGETARNLFIPVGNTYNMGNSQFIQINGKARTFIGGETTYGELMNLGGQNKITVADNKRRYNPSGRLTDNLWWRFGQRWHFTLGVPSSTVFVRQGVTPDNDTIEEFQKANYVILSCADIRALGNVWQLRYSHGDKNTYGHTNGEKTKPDNGTIQITNRDGAITTYPIPNELPPAIAVYSTVKSSEFDIAIVGIH